MDFSYSQEAERLCSKSCAWLSTHLTATAIAQVAYAEDATRTRIPQPLTGVRVNGIAPATVRYGTEEQQTALLPRMHASDRGQLHLRTDTKGSMHQKVSSCSYLGALRHVYVGWPTTFRQNGLLPAEQSRRGRVFEPTPPRDLDLLCTSNEWDWE